MERLFRINSVEISKKELLIRGNIMDGFQYGQPAFFSAEWEPQLFPTQLLVEKLSNMSIKEFRKFRKDSDLDIEQALRAKSIGSFYNVDIFVYNHKLKVQNFYKNFGPYDPFQSVVKELMTSLHLSTTDMKKICQREFLVSSYQLLSLTDRKQLIDYLRWDFKGLD